VKSLVAGGQLEFINGGWVSSDEACPSYEELIDNILAGHAFLWRNFGITPKHAWHLDAFGHSGAVPELFAKMGFETITFARMDEEERKYRVDGMNLQFEWKQDFVGINASQSVDNGFSLFTNFLHFHYEAPC
jgi:hypothetical protein